MIFLDPPALDDWMNTSEGEEDLGQFGLSHSPDKHSGPVTPYKSMPNLLPIQRLESRRYKSAVIVKRCCNGSVSLKQQIQQRNRDTIGSDAFIRGLRDEYEARQYCDAVMENTLMELQNTCNVAENIVQTGADMSEELARQDRVIQQADRCVHSTEQDLNETRWRLRGMMHLRGKLVNFIWDKKPVAKSYSDFASETREFRTSTASLSSYLPHSSQKKTTEEKIKVGVDRLSSTLDKVQRQQLAIADELEHQDTKLNKFDLNMGRVHGKIYRQTDLITRL